MGKNQDKKERERKRSKDYRRNKEKQRADMFICNFPISRRPFGAIFWAKLTLYSSRSPSIFGGNLSPN